MEEASPMSSFPEAARGFSLDPTMASQIEQNLKQFPDNFPDRMSLIAYYGSRDPRSKEDEIALRQHILWAIENRPASTFAGSWYMHAHPNIDKKAWKEGKSAWLRQVELHPNEAVIFKHAGSFFASGQSYQYGKRAELLLSQAAALDSQDTQSLCLLWMLYVNRMQKPHTAKQSRKMWGVKALCATELFAERDQTRQYKQTTDMALPCLAFEAEEFSLAESSAHQLLQESDPSKRSYSLRAHYAHLVLGRLALQAGQIASAEKHLLEMADVPGSPLFMSISEPNMTLAVELLARGREAVVFEYINQYRKYDEDEWLQAWLDWVNLVKGDTILDVPDIDYGVFLFARFL